jgi:hypothetical protein
MKKLMLLTSLLASVSVFSTFAADDTLKGKIKIKNDTNKNVTVMATYATNNSPDDQRYIVDKKSYTTINFKTKVTIKGKEKDSGKLVQLDKVDANDKVLASIKDIKEKGTYLISEKGFTKE